MAFGQIGRCIKQAWDEDYPPELAPANVKGRKMWRKVLRLVELIVEKFHMGPAEAESFRGCCGDLADSKDEQAAIRRAYITLLELPHGGLRTRLQAVLATLRDEIAVGAKKEPQSVQDSYEQWVREHPSKFAISSAYRDK